MSGKFLRIVAPHFCAHAEVIDRHVSTLPNDVAPILKYMRGWDGRRVADYCKRKGWKLSVHEYPP